MSKANVQGSGTAPTAWGRAGYGLATLWIFGGAAFFFLRFSQAVYRAHAASIDGLLAGVARALGLDGLGS